MIKNLKPEWLKKPFDNPQKNIIEPVYDDEIINKLKKCPIDKMREIAEKSRVAYIKEIDFSDYDEKDRDNFIKELSDISDMADYQVKIIRNELGIE